MFELLKQRLRKRKPLILIFLGEFKTVKGLMNQNVARTRSRILDIQERAQPPPEKPRNDFYVI